MTPQPNTEALLAKLRALHQEREEVIATWRSPKAEFPALFELVVVRGMTTEDAGKELGLSGEGVARKLRPLKALYGLNGTLSWQKHREALTSKVPRPYKDLTDTQLIQAVKRENVQAVKSRRELGKRSRKLLDDMSKVITAILRQGEMSAGDIARELGVSEMTVSRYRRKVT